MWLPPLEGALTSSAGPAVRRRLSLQPTAGPCRSPMLFKGAAAASESWLRSSRSLQPTSRAEASARAPPAPPRAPPPGPAPAPLGPPPPSQPRPHGGPAAARLPCCPVERVPSGWGKLGALRGTNASPGVRTALDFTRSPRKGKE